MRKAKKEKNLSLDNLSIRVIMPKSRNLSIGNSKRLGEWAEKEFRKYKNGK